MSTNHGIDQVVTTAITAPDQTAAPNAEKLRALAAQFESLLISQMLREMRASMLDDDEGTGFESGPLSDTLFTELSLALSRAGGIGLGDALAEPLARQTGQAGEEVPAPPAGAERVDARPSIISGEVTSNYGWRRDPISGARRFHKGVDIAMPVGQAVPAARGGQVVFAGEMAGYGRTVVVSHEGRITTRYAHLSEITVRPGDQVSGGQLIGKSGATGRATGPHLHFEVLESGQPIDPASLGMPGL